MSHHRPCRVDHDHHESHAELVTAALSGNNATIAKIMESHAATQTEMMTLLQSTIESMQSSSVGEPSSEQSVSSADAGPCIPRIAVIGAGLAGLTAALRLNEAGYDLELFEGSDRIGGRVWTRKFDTGLVYERGGELVDQNHRQITQLMQSLRINRQDVFNAQTNGTEPIYNVIDPATIGTSNTPINYTFSQATEDLKKCWKALKKDVQQCSYPTTFQISTDRGCVVDGAPRVSDPAVPPGGFSMETYVDYLTGPLGGNLGGATSKLAQLLKVAYNIEFGAEPKDQSALNLLYLLGYTGPGQLRVFGKSNEKYHIGERDGGDQQVFGSQGLAYALRQELSAPFNSNPATFHMQHRLVAIYRLNLIPANHADNLPLNDPDRGSKKYLLKFQDIANGNAVVKRVFERVVLAIPFATMRETPIPNSVGTWPGVDYQYAGFSFAKRSSIAEIGMSRNSKLNVEFTDRYWRDLGYNGDAYQTDVISDPSYPASYTETGFQATWEVSRAQDDRSKLSIGPADALPGILVSYNGGDYVDQFGDSDIDTAGAIAKKDQFLAQLDAVFGGNAASHFDSANAADHIDMYNWSLNEWARGGYSYWKPRQYKKFAGAESLREPQDDTTPYWRNCYFAGEHTSYCFQGFMNGAVESGERVAAEILGDFKKLKYDTDF